MSEDAARRPASAELLTATSSRMARLDERQAAPIEMADAVQWLARVAHCYAPPLHDRLSLHFDEGTRCLTTPELAPATRLGLRLPGLIFQFHEHGVPTPHPLDVDDRSSTEIEAWLLAELLHRGFDRSLFRKELPYDWRDQMSGDEAKYGPHRLSGELHRLTQDLVEAAVDLRKASRIAAAQGRATQASDLLFWPDRCTVGFALRRDGRNVEVAYEPDAAGGGHFRVSERPAATRADVLVARTPDAEALAHEIARAIESSEQK